MWSTRSPAPLSLDLHPSRRLSLLLGGSHLAALVAVMFLTDLPVWLGLILCLSVLASLGWNLARHDPRSPWGVVWLQCAPDGRFILTSNRGRRREARLIGAYRHPQLVLLNLATSRLGRRTVVIFRDACSPAVHRRLRVRLTTWRWGDEEEF